jgi:hypothetical protein
VRALKERTFKLSNLQEVLRAFDNTLQVAMLSLWIIGLSKIPFTTISRGSKSFVRKGFKKGRLGRSGSFQRPLAGGLAGPVYSFGLSNLELSRPRLSDMRSRERMVICC